MSALKLCGGCAKDIYPMEEQINCDGEKCYTEHHVLPTA